MSDFNEIKDVDVVVKSIINHEDSSEAIEAMAHEDEQLEITGYLVSITVTYYDGHQSDTYVTGGDSVADERNMDYQALIEAAFDECQEFRDNDLRGFIEARKDNQVKVEVSIPKEIAAGDNISLDMGGEDVHLDAAPEEVHEDG